MGEYTSFCITIHVQQQKFIDKCSEVIKLTLFSV